MKHKHPEKVKSLFISDVHLGSRSANSSGVLEILKKYSPEKLFIVGDFIDGWKLQRRHYWTQDDTNLIRKILSYTKENVEVIYIIGNHDDFLRQYDDMHFGNITFMEEVVHDGYFIVHGDHYDGIVNLKWLAKIGSIGYELAMDIDRLLKKVGVRRSLSHTLKTKVKDAVKFITNFEEEVVRQATLRGCHGVICGHIHKPEDKNINGVRYLNCGDWIENNSYIIQHMDGSYELKKS
jgi:UDP-2,3-diacylglucosamine pyrophosphatase LpxH